eukprot:633293-Pleurochrysis_carterae.AAC.3
MRRGLAFVNRAQTAADLALEIVHLELELLQVRARRAERAVRRRLKRDGTPQLLRHLHACLQPCALLRQHVGPVWASSSQRQSDSAAVRLAARDVRARGDGVCCGDCGGCFCCGCCTCAGAATGALCSAVHAAGARADKVFRAFVVQSAVATGCARPTMIVPAFKPASTPEDVLVGRAPPPPPQTSPQAPPPPPPPILSPLPLLSPPPT